PPSYIHPQAPPVVAGGDMRSVGGKHRTGNACHAKLSLSPGDSTVNTIRLGMCAQTQFNLESAPGSFTRYGGTASLPQPLRYPGSVVYRAPPWGRGYPGEVRGGTAALGGGPDAPPSSPRDRAAAPARGLPGGPRPARRGRRALRQLPRRGRPRHAAARGLRHRPGTLDRPAYRCRQHPANRAVPPRPAPPQPMRETANAPVAASPTGAAPSPEIGPLTGCAVIVK